MLGFFDFFHSRGEWEEANIIYFVIHDPGNTVSD